MCSQNISMQDFTAKLLEHDIVKLVQDSDSYYDKRDLQYRITGLVDEGDFYPGFGKLFS